MDGTRCPQRGPVAGTAHAGSTVAEATAGARPSGPALAHRPDAVALQPPLVLPGRRAGCVQPLSGALRVVTDGRSDTVRSAGSARRLPHLLQPTPTTLCSALLVSARLLSRRSNCAAGRA